ncbi:MAG: immunoglobulin domain-containing protein, partial [Phycisphaerales bacterium]|nr:immunoglobulin domain-containing protein [Phycisphaerales bacterium]
MQSGSHSADLYRWRRNGIDLVNGGRISGASTTNLTITNLSAADSGNYVLAATSICDQTTTSQTAVINVRCFTRGDCNCDGAVDNFDVDAFVLALV